MMILRLLHRWTGGVIGLLLALMGLTGTLLLYRDAWVRWTVPHAGDALRPIDAGVIARLLDAAPRPSGIVLADDDLGVHQLLFRPGSAGAYADQTGNTVAHWAASSGRPELWVFDLHHHLLIGETGDTIIGIAALIGLGFLVTGTLLWWRTRKTFAPRPLPKRASRPAIVRHHRDLGIIVAPILAVSFVTGALITLKPVEALVLLPWRSANGLPAFRAKPPVTFGALPAHPDWGAMIATAAQRFPGSRLRAITLPAKPGLPIVLRLRQSGDWLPNGNTSLWFDAASVKLAAVRDPARFNTGVAISTSLFPIHSAAVGGWLWTLALTAAGLSLTMLGSLTVVTFWRHR